MTRLHDTKKLEPKVCNCGWQRPVLFDFSEDPLGKKPIVIPLQEFYFVFDCPVCGDRWYVRAAKVS